MTPLLFVNGFNRSGTTLLTSAVTAATGGTTLTVGDLARHIPSLRAFLASTQESGIIPDRGVDRLPVTESTPEEYGWYLNALIERFRFGPTAIAAGVMEKLIDELSTGDDLPVVLKNPWDMGSEQSILDHFPQARVIIVRRRIGAMEASLERAWERMATSYGYIEALLADPVFAAEMIAVIVDDEKRRATVAETKTTTRESIQALCESVQQLPPDRVAFVSYDELRADPRAGAAWAAHLVDQEALATAVAKLTFAEYNEAQPEGGEVAALDTAWAAAWQQARERQIDAGILGGPSPIR